MILKHGLLGGLLSGFICLFIVVTASVSAQEAGRDKAWAFQVTPYALFVNIDGDAQVGRTRGTDISISTGDVLENLDLAFMVRLEGLYRQKWGVFVDYGFMDLEKETIGPVNGVVTAGVRQTVIDLFVFRRFPSDFGALDILAGARRWRNKLHLVVDPSFWPGAVSTTVEEDWWDGFIGARALFDINQDWTLHLRGDIGGLGLSSDFTFNTLAGVMYHLTDAISLDIGYKALWVDYETGTQGELGRFAYDTVTHGPVVGMVFRF